MPTIRLDRIKVVLPDFAVKINLFILLFVLIFCFQGCKQSAEDANQDSSILNWVEQFPNVLDYSGKPDSAFDRSVYIFSDQGAWMGYALPDSDGKGLLGSFTGPYLMTQSNGVWIDSVLTRLQILDANHRPVDFQMAEAVEVTAYPGKLYQSFLLTDSGLRVEVELIFISDRSALQTLSVTNLRKREDVSYKVRWTGNSFLEGVSFDSTGNGVEINFEGNEHKGWVQANSDSGFKTKMENEKYEFISQFQSLDAGTSKQYTLTHTFGFSPSELMDEKALLTEALTEPEKFLDHNNSIWGGHVSHLVLNLKPGFQSADNEGVVVKCLQTLMNNWRSPAGQLNHSGLFPSYNYKWFNGFWAWDSWKHAVALKHIDPKLAKDQIRAMFDFQDEYGMIADCVYRDNLIEENNWRNTKPPLAAWAVWEIYQESLDKDFLLEMLPQLESYHQWWYQYRDHDQNGLCEYGSTDGTLVAAKWESGMDNAVRFDNSSILENGINAWSLNQESVDLNAFLAAEKKYLGQLTAAIGEMEKSQNYMEQASQLKSLIQSNFFDDKTGWFYDIDLETKEHIKVQGSEGWIPLWAGIATPEQAERVSETMLDTTKFATYIPFPTLSADHPKFTPQNGYWRGPIWLDQVYFAIKGLENYGYYEEVNQFTNQVLNNLEGLKNSDLPIRENYHPLTGKGMEANHFSWSAAHLLMLLSNDTNK